MIAMLGAANGRGLVVEQDDELWQGLRGDDEQPGPSTERSPVSRRVDRSTAIRAQQIVYGSRRAVWKDDWEGGLDASTRREDHNLHIGWSFVEMVSLPQGVTFFLWMFVRQSSPVAAVGTYDGGQCDSV